MKAAAPALQTLRRSGVKPRSKDDVLFGKEIIKLIALRYRINLLIDAHCRVASKWILG